MEYKSQNVVCQNCKASFAIEPEDFNFYEKIKVPPPSFCPECRLVRRITWRNERSLYKRLCAKTGKEIIAKNIVKSQSNLIDPLINELLSSPDYLIRLGAINAILSITDTTLESRLKEISENDTVATVKKTASKVLLILGSKK